MGGKTSKSTQTITIPPEVLARYNAINARADVVTNKPYERYTGEFVAPLTETQRAGMANINAAAGMAQPYFGAATNQLLQAQGQTQPLFQRAGDVIESGLSGAQGYNTAATDFALQGGNRVDPRELQIQQFMSPYLQNVLQGTAGILNQQNQLQQAGQMGQAIRSGAFGGDRSGIAAANLAQQQNLANAKIYSDILNQGFNTALGAAQQQQGVYLSSDQANRAALQALSDRLRGIGETSFGQNITAAGAGRDLAKDIYGTGAATSAALAGLGTGAQGAAIEGAQAQLSAGQVEQATKQAEDTARYNQFLQEQSLPYQQLKLASDIAQGTGALSGSTTTTAQPGGFFSDERLKENIRPVGKTFDGQTIHSFNYKGDPRTQIGLIAQEVQKHHPDAVGLAGGYKTVDYDKATEDAADRGHMAHGGYASMGGGVMPQHAGQGFAGGGVVGFDPALMQQILAAQQAMYAPFSQNAGNVYAGGPGAVGGLVPQVDSVSRSLMTPGDLPGIRSGIEKVGDIANLGKTIGELGGEVGAWNWGGKEEDKKTPVLGSDAAVNASVNRTVSTLPTGVAPPEPYKDEPPTVDDLNRAVDEKSRLNRAYGGGLPYQSGMTGPGLDIPGSGGESGSAPQLMTAGPLPQRQSGFSKLLNTASKAASIYNYFKPKEVATGGAIPYQSGMTGRGLEIPNSDDDSKPELMTAGDMPEKRKSGLSKLLDKGEKAAAIYAAFASDKRLKENVKPIGKLFDGQVVYSYNYKGDPRTQIGLIAQEVEDHKPSAVGLSGGYKTVDYKKATSAAAHRGHFAVGGMPEMEEDPIPSYEPTGLYHGENKFIRNLFKSTASGNKNIDLMSGEEMPQAASERPQEEPSETPEEKTGLAAAAEEGLPELLQPKRRQPTGVSPIRPILPKNLSAISQLIMRAEGDGAAKTSSALGKYGIIENTYVNYFKKAFPDQARELGDQGIKALRVTPEGRRINEQLGPMIIADNAKHLEKSGFEPNAGNVYLAHFLGPAGAVRALSADPNAPIESAVDRKAIAANAPVFNKIRTVGDLVNWSNNLMNRRAREIGRGRYQDGGTPTDKKLLPDDIADLMADEERRSTGLAAGETPTPPVSEQQEAAPTGVVPAPAETTAVTPAATPIATPAATPAATTEKAPAVGVAAPEKEDTNFFRGLTKGKATSVIPFLTGLAAMGTAPTRSLGVALSAGLGAGAQAAQGQRAFGIKQGELKVAQQLADARTMEITQGILNNRFKLLEGGVVFDTVTQSVLPAKDAATARALLLKMGPMEAVSGAGFAGTPIKEYMQQHPTAGTSLPTWVFKPFYKANPNDANSTIYAGAETSPGALMARKDMDDAKIAKDQLYAQLSSPDVGGTERQQQLAGQYRIAEDRYKNAFELWKKAIVDNSSTAILALQSGNQALISTNAAALAPLIENAQIAIQNKSAIQQILPTVQAGGPLSTMLSKIGATMKQVGFDADFVDNIIGSPESVQTQNLLVTQLQAAGMDARAIEALRAGSGANFSQKAVEALLMSQLKKADSQIAAAQAANEAFQLNPLGGNVAGTGLSTTAGELNAKYFTQMPSASTIAKMQKGQVYYVAGVRHVK